MPEVNRVPTRPLHRAQATAAAGTDHASDELNASYPFSARPVPRPPQPLAQPGLQKTGSPHPTPKADRLLGLLTFTYHGCLFISRTSSPLQPFHNTRNSRPAPIALHSQSKTSSLSLYVPDEHRFTPMQRRAQMRRNPCESVFIRGFDQSPSISLAWALWISRSRWFDPSTYRRYTAMGIVVATLSKKQRIHRLHRLSQIPRSEAVLWNVPEREVALPGPHAGKHGIPRLSSKAARSTTSRARALPSTAW